MFYFDLYIPTGLMCENLHCVLIKTLSPTTTSPIMFYRTGKFIEISVPLILFVAAARGMWGLLATKVEGIIHLAAAVLLIFRTAAMAYSLHFGCFFLLLCCDRNSKT